MILIVEKCGTIMVMEIGMTSRRKYENVKIKVKKFWELPKGHNPHLTGAGLMDNRPKRQRTRRDLDKSWREEYDV